MKILVTGSNGMLGWGIKKEFADDEMHYTGRDTLDITNRTQVMSFAENAYDVVIHCAAMTNHYECEIKPKEAYYVNVYGTGNMCELANKCNALFIYVGTCGIFDGTYPLYTRKDKPCPINHYGRSKFYGEVITESFANRYNIIRAGWMMGGGEGLDHKFVGLIYEQMKEKKEIYAIDDVHGIPTYSPYFARFLRHFIMSQYLNGIYHYYNNPASRYDVAHAFAEAVNYTGRIIPINHYDYHAIRPCKVPYTKCEVLAPSSPAEGFKTPDWREGIKEYAKECYDENTLPAA